jgi:hypothetical protein
MNCIIEGIDFYQLEAMKYYSPSTSWSAEKKKENAMQKIFSGEWWGAQKRDGIFCMCGRNQDGDIFLRPRAKNTKGEFVNKVDWVPQIHRYLNELEPGTVLLGELYLPRDEQAKSTSSIMNSLQPRAVKKQQKEEDKLHLYIFDILALEGESWLNKRAEDRFEELNILWRAYPGQYVEYAEYYNGQELWDMLQQLLADGYEGVVITHQDAPYQPGKRSNKVSLKIKKELQDTVDCIMIGANAPAREYTGKEIETWPYWINDRTNEKIVDNEISNVTECTKTYENYSNGVALTPVTKNWFYGWAGSWKLGAFKDGKIVQIGSLSGLTDEMKENWKDYVGKVCEVSAMETSENQEGGRGLRHPKLIAIRDDIDKLECTYERIFEK